MDIRTAPPGWLAIFGDDATGTSASDRAATSKVKFVRSQDELGLFKASSKGRTFTAKEALLRFGSERLIEIWQDGSAILPASPAEPAKTLRVRREQLGLTQTELAHYVGVDINEVARAESPDFTTSIHILTSLAIALGLDDAVLGFRPGANGDRPLAVRLKEWRDNGMSANTIAKLSGITWVIATQYRLQQLVTPNCEPMTGFVPSDYYGHAGYQVWKVARDLAQETRRLLGFSETEPIYKLREVCRRLQVPLVHSELPSSIAGATLATGAVRGIVVNVNGNDGNVWVQRATVAHELGHLLWDTAHSLDALVVDTLDQIQRIDYDQGGKDFVEKRANAFAVELIAPKNGILEFTAGLDTKDEMAISSAIRACMEQFGLSQTAMRYHMRNAYDHEFDLARISYVDPAPTEEWTVREQFTDDYFVIPTTPIERRGEFSGVVAHAENQGWLSEEAAASYLNATVEQYRTEAPHIMGLY